ncbi:hypothetical protein BC936DRAFT_141324 [Jimgerdemannia flammicorona]|uniref:Uncharacterized protein n=1 Tax=Jimgerdemannia flammicorona TaxID=994334 RepID=A0A433A2F5_9FUNG|nr:hypothetical protein BC936DRAFT_141324 [Jimgerdemannia flammicorona]
MVWIFDYWSRFIDPDSLNTAKNQVKHLATALAATAFTPHCQSRILAVLSPVCPRSCVLRRMAATECLLLRTDPAKESWLDDVDPAKPIPINPFENLLVNSTGLASDSPFAVRGGNLDYLRLLDAITVLGFALEDERALKAQPFIVDRIEKRLRAMHGKIGGFTVWPRGSHGFWCFCCIVSCGLDLRKIPRLCDFVPHTITLRTWCH